MVCKSFSRRLSNNICNRGDQKAEKEIQMLLSHLNVQNQEKVLDLCCGEGRHNRFLARQGFDVTAVDLSTTLLKIALQELDLQ